MFLCLIFTHDRKIERSCERFFWSLAYDLIFSPDSRVRLPTFHTNCTDGSWDDVDAVDASRSSDKMVDEMSYSD